MDGGLNFYLNIKSDLYFQNHHVWEIMQLSHCLFMDTVFKSKENSITEISTVDFYTFLIFMTNARTPVAMYWGLLGLFVVTVIAFTRKNI